MKILVFLMALTIPAVGQQAVEATPQPSKMAHQTSGGVFGFQAGMTKDSLIARLGSKAIVRTLADDMIVFSSAPIPHPAFKEYGVRFSPKDGLVQVMAFSPPIETNESGEQLKSKFAEISDALTAKYGNGLKVDRLNHGSIWNEPNDWMMGLVKKDRTLETIWTGDKDKLPNRLTGVMVEVKALSSGSGLILLRYDFEGFAAYAQAKRQKRDSAF